MEKTKMDEKADEYIIKQLNEIPKILTRQISTKNNIKFNTRDDFNQIKQRIDDFINNENDERFFVFPGLRGVGKTTLLLQSYEYLLKQKDVNPNNLLYVSCEAINSIAQADVYKIIDSYTQMIHNTTPALLETPVYIFIDEAHYDYKWAVHGKIIKDTSPNIFMIFSGYSSLHLNYNADAARRLKIQNIPPLNYSQHLKLKYNYHTDISNDLIDLIFKGEIEKAQEKENQMKNDLINLIDYDLNDWDDFLKYGAFPSTLDKKYKEDIQSELWSIISKIISQDMVNVFNLNRNKQNNIYRVLTFLASQKPGEISQGSMANDLNISKSSVNSIFNILEHTHLIFHYEAYGAGKRTKKQWKYYIATPSLRHSINTKFGITYVDTNDYKGVLLENLIGTSLFNLSNNEKFYNFKTYYDAQKGCADFIIQKAFERPIPIELRLSKKSPKQVKKSMNKCKSEYGILISNKTKSIERKNDVIYISPKTFSLL